MQTKRAYKSHVVPVVLSLVLDRVEYHAHMVVAVIYDNVVLEKKKESERIND